MFFVDSALFDHPLTPSFIVLNAGHTTRTAVLSRVRYLHGDFCMQLTYWLSYVTLCQHSVVTAVVIM